jgi:hypothetical protein
MCGTSARWQELFQQSYLPCKRCSKCVCGPGWGSDDCSVPVSVSVACSASAVVVDIAGECCFGNIDSVTGKCCVGQGTPVDGSGRCCAAGQTVDVCGVYGGTGVAMDVQGSCCHTPLPPSGICCTSGVLGSCGVCDGNDQCGCVQSLLCMCGVYLVAWRARV